MNATPYDILLQHPVRFTRKQKKAFLDEGADYVRSIGYSCFMDSDSFGRRNLIVGNPEQAEYLITAPYATALRWPLTHKMCQNTAAVLTSLEMMKTVLAQHRNKICFVLFDMTKSHMAASKSYAKRYKNSLARQLVWHLDGVGDRDHILFLPNRNVMLCESYMNCLRKCCTTLGRKTLDIGNKRFCLSEKNRFPNCIQVSAFDKQPKGKYINCFPVDRSFPTAITNVNILRTAIVSAIVCDAG